MFWEQFNQVVVNRGKPFNIRKATTDHWYDIAVGSSEAHIAINLVNKDGMIVVEPVSYTHLDVYKRQGIEWEHKDTHEKHLSVLDYKKQERAAEVEKLGAEIEQKQAEFKVLSERIHNYDEGINDLTELTNSLDNSPEYQLPEPQGLMSAKAYRSKIVEPFVKRLKALIDVYKRQAECLRRHFHITGIFIIFRIVITPLVIVLTADVAIAIFFSLFCPRI